jgi:ribonuclease G
VSAQALLIDRQGPLTRAAVLTGGRLTDLHIDRDDRPSLQGAVFLGRVERIVPALDGAFVDLGTGKPGLLATADARGPKGRVERIGSLLRAGQGVLVQVKADALGAKGPTLTMDIALPGRFLVHAPFGKAIAVSKRLSADPARRAALLARLEAAVTGSGWVARSGAADASPDLLTAEADALSAEWRDLQAAQAATPPACLLPAPGAAVRALIEAGPKAPHIVIDDDALAATLARWCAARAPDLTPIRHKGATGLFAAHDLDDAIAALTRPQVPLPGGGSLVIERTEALWAVDVNAGERGNALEVNREAAFELARQLRLRNVGGIVVVDFVNMRGRGDAERLLAALTAAVDGDPVQTHVYGLSKLSLVELARARRGAALVDVLDPSFWKD